MKKCGMCNTQKETTEYNKQAKTKDGLQHYCRRCYKYYKAKLRYNLDKEDYDRFLKILYIYNSRNKFSFRDLITRKKIDVWSFKKEGNLVDIVSWVLMPNHFHLILICPRSDLWQGDYNPVTEFMRKISTAYVMYFNKKYNRSGSLFEGKFKSKHIGEENYFNLIPTWSKKTIRPYGPLFRHMLGLFQNWSCFGWKKSPYGNEHGSGKLGFGLRGGLRGLRGALGA